MLLPVQAQQKPVEPGTVDAELIRSQSTSSWRIPLGLAAAGGVGLLMRGVRQTSARSDHPSSGLPAEKSTRNEPTGGPKQTSVSLPIAAEPSSRGVKPADGIPLLPASINDSRPRRAVIGATDPSWDINGRAR